MRLHLLLIGVFLFLGSWTAVAGEPQKVVGISQSQPAEGPYVAVEGGYMVPYTIVIPGTKVEVEMVPVPGGTFLMGSPEDEPGHQEDEEPQVEIEVAPFWAAKFETTWKEYKVYMSMYKLFKILQSQGLRTVDSRSDIDAVTAPTELYEPSFTFEFGQDPDLPAVTMTQFAAKQYTKWLSLLTGQQYRLPTEAEWEYACRAGAQTAYSFGDDPAELDEYAWYYDNSDGFPHKIGLKKPNAFGLHDMHGNVMEWVIDGYTEDGYHALSKKGKKLTVLEAIQWATEADQRVVRGGSFQDDPEQLRCAARLASQGEDWKTEDPNIPLSPWWYTDDPSRGIGFRIVRSLTPLDRELMKKFWEIDHEDIDLDVQMRLDEGRGVISPVDPTLGDQILESGQ